MQKLSTVDPSQCLSDVEMAARPNLKYLLLGDGPRFDLDLPPRGRWKRRPRMPMD